MMKELERGVIPEEMFPNEKAAVIIDGMALVQKTKPADTFGEFAKQLLKSAIATSATASRIDIVFDVYQEISIKSLERSRRSTGILKLKNIEAAHKIKQWKKVLGSTENKTALIGFLYSEWEKPFYQNLLKDKILFITYLSLCKRITSNSSTNITDLTCNQEEADTRMFFHANHVDKDNFRSIVIVTPDTDVSLLALTYQNRLSADIHINTGVGNKNRILSVKKMIKNIVLRCSVDVSVQTLCDAVLGLHAFTGCDSISSFSGKGKVRALKLMLKNKTYVDMFSLFGLDWKPMLAMMRLNLD